MTTALIADDEDGPREQLLAALREAWPQLHVVATAANGVDAWDAFLEHGPDVCFLDIRMPGLSGLDVARRIGSQAAVVFATAYDEHAIAAFDAGAADYLLKPVDPLRLSQTVQRLQARLQPARALDIGALAEQLARAGALAPRREPLAVIQAGVGKEVRLIRTAEVIYFEADSRYTRVGARRRRGADPHAAEGAAGATRRDAVLAGAPVGDREPPLDRVGRARGRGRDAPHPARARREAAGVAPLPGPVQGPVSGGQRAPRGARASQRRGSARAGQQSGTRHPCAFALPTMTGLPIPRFDIFYRYEELTRLLFDYSAAAPDLVQVQSIGRSHEGRDIWVVTVTNAATGDAGDKPAFWADGNIHAAELTASTTVLYYLHHLVTRYGQDREVTGLLDTRAVYLCPRLNPDGAELALADRPRHIRSSTRPWPFDEEPVDGLTIEDVDGDGRVLSMRIPDPHGAYKQATRPSRA